MGIDSAIGFGVAIGGVLWKYDPKFLFLVSALAVLLVAGLLATGNIRFAQIPYHLPE